MNKTIKRIVTASLTLAVVFGSFTSAWAAQEASLPLQTIKQKKDNWCWAACAEMIGKYQWFTSRTQTDAVKYIFGNTEDQGGTRKQTAEAINYIAWDYTDYGSKSGTFSKSEIMDNIDNKSPFVVGVSDGSSGHMYVCYGYNSYGNYVRLIDPYDKSKNEVLYARVLSGNDWGEGKPWKDTVYER